MYTTHISLKNAFGAADRIMSEYENMYNNPKNSHEKKVAHYGLVAIRKVKRELMEDVQKRSS